MAYKKLKLYDDDEFMLPIKEGTRIRFVYLVNEIKEPPRGYLPQKNQTVKPDQPNQSLFQTIRSKISPIRTVRFGSKPNQKLMCFVII